MQRTEKIVEDYQLLETTQILPNGIHVIRGRNVKTDTPVTIKKVFLEKQENGQNRSQRQAVLMRQIEAIKNLNLSRLIKCLKLIRTKRSIYCVFEEYPPYQLDTYLQNFNPSDAERTKFAQAITETLIKIHEKGYIYANLHPGCILVDDVKNRLKFIGLQNLTKKGSQEILQFQGNEEYMAPEITNKGTISTTSDGYSLGKLFCLLGIDMMKANELVVKTPIQNIIKSLIQENPLKRPNLHTVLLCLQIKGNQKSTSESNDLSFSIDKTKKYKSVWNIRTSTSKKKQSVSKNSSAYRENMKNKKKLRKVLKIRNLALYLLDLAKFALKEWNLRLCYFLIKKATIISGNLLFQLKKDKLQKKANFEEIFSIIQQQYEEQLIYLNNLKKRLVDCKMIEQSESDSHLDESVLEKEIREFLKEKRKQIKSKKTDYKSEERKVLIHLYKLSEKLCYGSFEKFFDEAFSEDTLQMQNQRYIQYVKKLPTNELMRKIDQVINQ